MLLLFVVEKPLTWSSTKVGNVAQISMQLIDRLRVKNFVATFGGLLRLRVSHRNKDAGWRLDSADDFS